GEHTPPPNLPLKKGEEPHRARGTLKPHPPASPSPFFRGRLGGGYTVAYGSNASPNHQPDTLPLEGFGATVGKSLQWSDLSREGHESYARMAGRIETGEAGATGPTPSPLRGGQQS